MRIILTRTGPHTVTAEAVIYKLLSLNCFMLFALNALFHKKLSIISSIDVKRLLRSLFFQP